MCLCKMSRRTGSGTKHFLILQELRKYKQTEPLFITYKQKETYAQLPWELREKRTSTKTSEFLTLRG